MQITATCGSPWLASRCALDRAWRRLSTDAFASDLAASELCCDLKALEDKTVDDLAGLYSSAMTRLLDQHVEN